MEFVPNGPVNKTLGQIMACRLNRHHGIIWNNDGLVYLCSKTLFSPDELTLYLQSSSQKHVSFGFGIIYQIITQELACLT